VDLVYGGTGWQRTKKSRDDIQELIHLLQNDQRQTLLWGFLVTIAHSYFTIPNKTCFVSSSIPLYEPLTHLMYIALPYDHLPSLLCPFKDIVVSFNSS
jgi:hypothetical protein